MAVADVTVILVFLAVFNYAMLYRRNSFLGNMVFLGIGGFMMYLGVASGLIYRGAGLIMILGSLANIIYDFSSSSA